MSTIYVSNQEKSNKLSELIDYYEVCNRAEGKSPRTISWYSANLGHFCSYLQSRHLPDSLDNIDTKLLREYVLYLLKKPKYENHPYIPCRGELLSAATVHGYVRTLRTFFSWLVAEELIHNNIARDLKPPKVPKKVISTLSDEEIRNILGTFNPKSSSDIRNRTIFLLLIDTGLRIGELTDLKMGNLNMDDGLFKVMGKGQKERIVPAGSNAQRALQKYLFRYRPEPANRNIDNVFLSVSGSPLTVNSMKLMFAKVGKRSGVHRLHAHLCRHTFATRFLMNGGDVFTLQQILGHSTLEMVRHYVNLASSHIVIQHQRYSPVDHLDLRKL